MNDVLPPNNTLQVTFSSLITFAATKAIIELNGPERGRRTAAVGAGTDGVSPIPDWPQWVESCPRENRKMAIEALNSANT
ncbi:hypothetical protein [Acidihalobacter yilgarnensis]|uniref:hypothetical protein n=1 Tax=Acidihalobacter yilgarnensis TaxID=2819280 RepID=UPI0012EA3E3A|nr:hypothetical protein [Acidihalobacter yilgarnensis]